MKLRTLLLGYLLMSGLASAGNCKKEFSYGFDSLADPYRFLEYEPIVHIISRSAGHTLEFVFRPGFIPILFVDGQPVDLPTDPQGYADHEAVNNEIAALCGPDFLRDGPVSPSAAERTLLAPPTVQTRAAGQTKEDVAIADFNGDGILDSAVLTGSGIFVTLRGANQTSLSSRLYPVTGVGVAQNIVTADFNGDGLPDLAVTQGTFSTSANPFPPGNVVILLGKSDGTFGPPLTTAVGPVGNSYLATGDFNGDGIADLALTHTVSTGAGRVAVLLSKRDGTFSPAVDYPVGPTPFTLVAADFTGDGKLDLAALDAFGTANKVWVLPGRGDGTFQPAVSSPSLTKEGFLAYVDLNRDGKLDLVIADQPASAMEVMMGKGDGTFQAGKEYLIGAHPTSIAILPLQDGSTSLFAADNAGSDLFLAFVSSDGVVHSPELQTIGSGPFALAAADLNGDKKPDLVLADTAAGKLYVELSRGKSTFANPVSYSAGAQPGVLAIADLNGDGKPDVIAADTAGLDVLLGKGDGTLGAVNTFPSGKLTSLTVADFNSDGKLDVAAASAAGGGIELFLGNGNGTFQSVRTTALRNALAAVSGDFNGDGKPDLIVSNGAIDFQTPGNLSLLLGNGDGTFQAPRNIALPAPLFSNALAVGDLNGDGKLDVVTAVFNGGRSKIEILLGNGDGTFQTPILIDSNTAPPMIAITDLNGDGKADLVMADCCGLSEAGFMLGNGDGTFQPESQFPSGPNPQAFAIADFNGDGKPDLAIGGQIEALGPRIGTLAILSNIFGPASAAVVNGASLTSAANPTAKSLAPGSLAIAYGADLAQGTPGATSLPLPNSFGGTTVSLVDSAGKQWQAPLIYVSAAQVNFLLPSGVATGAAQFTITSGDGTKSSATVQIAAVAPGLFTLNAANLVAASAIRLSADGTQVAEPVYSVTASGIVASPIDLGSNSDQVYLTLFGTGLQAAGTAGVKVSVGATDVPVQFAGSQGSFAGLDQVNVVLPHSLAGSGDVTLQLSAAGLAANAVRLTIR
jgi:uncharacterized protein (TIGR03437 family)